MEDGRIYPSRGFTKDKQIGLIAQDVEAVLPELVRTDRDGNKAVSYEKMVAVLIEAVKEQQGVVEKQQKEMKKLKTENKNLSSRVSTLETENQAIKAEFLQRIAVLERKAKSMNMVASK